MQRGTRRAAAWTACAGVALALLAQPAAAQSCGVSTQLSEDFSGGALPDGWSATGLWHVTEACAPVDGVVEGPHVAWSVDAQCDYDSPVLQGTLTSPWFTLPALPAGGLVWFEFDVDLEWEGSPETLVLALERPDGAQYVVYAPSSGSDSSAQQHEIGYLAGETLRVVVRFDAYDAWANTFAGVKLDGFSVRTFEGGFDDCNGNLVPDACDIAGGVSEDCDGDGVPDECQGALASACASSPNSVGAGAVLSGIGRPILSCNAFALRVEGAPPGQPGLFLCSPQLGPDLPFGNGVLCLAPPLWRLAPTATVDDGGACALRLDLGDLPGLGPIPPWSTLAFQFAYRDPAAAGAGFNCSDALHAQFVP